MSSCSSGSPPPLQKSYPHPQNPAAPPTPSPSPSPPTALCSRLSNGRLSAPSPTNSRSSIHGVSFLLQIGLTRETVTIESQEPSLPAVKDLVCSIVDQKVT
ncbi:KPCD3 kinase, partial [Polyodon spathula]|nr:KPCD3 kinase [Polyodon spathula]